MIQRANVWVQATPDRTCVFFLRQGCGAPDPARDNVARKSSHQSLPGMNTKIRTTVLRSLATLVVIISVWCAYQAGYKRGSKDALDWDFSTVIDGKVVPLGRGDALFRSRMELRPARGLNIVSGPLVIPGKQP
jgi:hypothetical protein